MQFKVGGSLTAKNADVYIERKVDRLVADYVSKGEYVLIVEPRQQGKSSLVNALMRQPRLQDYLFILIDVTVLDKSNEMAWYQSLINRVALQLDPFLKSELPATPTNSNGWRNFLSEFALLCAEKKKSIVFALDEIGAVDFPNSTMFFSVLRDIYNSRQAEPALEYLIFILVGAFHPRELITDDKVSPFNIAQRVRLPDFTLSEVEELVSKGGWETEICSILAKRIFEWAGGQPYLSQLLCAYLPAKAGDGDVDVAAEMIRKLDENHLPNILNRLENKVDLRNYIVRIMQGEKIKFYPREIQKQAQLELLGVIKEDTEGYTSIRNRIYKNALSSLLADNLTASTKEDDPKNVSIDANAFQVAATQFHYLNYEIRVGNKTKQGYPINLATDLGSDDNGFCTLQLQSEIFKDLIKPIEDGVTDEDLLAKFGKLLFEGLFSKNLAGHFRGSLSAARMKEAGLRILMQFLDPTLASLPWEFIIDPTEESSMALSTETPIVRYIPVTSPARKLITALPLRILVVISQSKEYPTLNHGMELTFIEEALQNLQAENLVRLHVLEHAYSEDILQEMRTFKPHIFHFIGHGSFSGNKAVLILEDANGEAVQKTENSFREFFSGIMDTRLVVLNSCQSGRSISAQALTGLAPRLLQKKIPAVVAMQFDLFDRSAGIFAQEFYRCLALGYPVEAAISEGRKGLFLRIGEGLRDWATPVLFLHTKDGTLFQLE